MAVDVKVPAVGESVQEAMIHKWYKKAGDFVEKDEVLMEIETDKATVAVPAETAGIIEILKKEGVTPMIMKEKILKGYCYVNEKGFEAKNDFDFWMKLCLDYNKKAKSSKKATKKKSDEHNNGPKTAPT